MQFVKANASEYLVVGRGGRVRNLGSAASALLWPGSTYALIPSTQQEATFEMTQESKDGVPLRFKGIVIYRVTDPETAAKRFDFSGEFGPGSIEKLIGHVCLGELRATVSQMVMEECIEQRKTALTETIANALKRVVEGSETMKGWGLELDVVQVAQVFIVDDELRRQLDAEVRNEIRGKSELSDVRTQEEVTLARLTSDRKLQGERLVTEREKIRIEQEKVRLHKDLEREGLESEIRMREQVKLAQTSSERRLQQDGLELEREKTKIDQEKFHLQKEFERDKIESDAPIRLLELEKQAEVLQQSVETRRLEAQVRQLEVEKEMLYERAQQALRKDILPLEQVPVVAEAVSRMFRGMNLSVYGADSPLLSAAVPIIDLLGNTLRKTGHGPAGNDGTPRQGGEAKAC